MYLLDTDIIIYSLKGVPAVVENLREHRNAYMALSVVSYGELVYGAEHSERRSQNLARIHRTAEIYPILPATRAIMDSFGRLKAELQSSGTTLDDFDLLVGTTALVHGLTVVTNNARQFARIPGLVTQNWAR